MGLKFLGGAESTPNTPRADQPESPQDTDSAFGALEALIKARLRETRKAERTPEQQLEDALAILGPLAERAATTGNPADIVTFTSKAMEMMRTLPANIAGSLYVSGIMAITMLRKNGRFPDGSPMGGDHE